MQELVLDHVCFKSDSETILKDISISINTGESLSLLGPSGCGKTTLLRIIAGLERVASGEILFRGKNMKCVPPHQRNFGMMFQDFALFPHRNVFENISFGLEMKKMSKKNIISRVNEMLELIGLEQYATRDIKELSGGERQRIALARTLAPSPDLIMLDEPLGALDRRLRERLLADLSTILNRTAITTIWVTHDHNEAFAVSDMVCVMNKGEVEQIASPENLYYNPANRTVADFLGLQNIMDERCIDGQLLIMPDAASVASDNETALYFDDRHAFTSSGENFLNQREVVISGIIEEAFFQGATRKISVATCMNSDILSSLRSMAKEDSRKLTDCKKVDVNNMSKYERGLQESLFSSRKTLFFDIPGDSAIPEIGQPILLKINTDKIKILN